MNIKINEFEKSESVEFELDGKSFNLSIDDYELTEYAKKTLFINNYETWQVDYIAKTLKDAMIMLDKPAQFEDSENGKKKRYTDDNGKDLIDEWAEGYPIEIFRVLMWEQMRKYHRRLGKKDDIALEVGKIADYAKRWLGVESKQ